MNEAGREALIAAGLRGHRQIRNAMHSSIMQTGECALGILHLTMHATRDEAVTCRNEAAGFLPVLLTCEERMTARYALTPSVLGRVVKLNDHQGLDFIGIARKLETPDDEPVTEAS